jgi:hypothetical protein
VRYQALRRRSPPVTAVSAKLATRDVTIEIRIGNLFDTPGDLVVGATTQFVTTVGDGAISPKSIQGQFTRRYYDNPAHLASDITQALAGIAPVAAEGPAVYPLGTVARVRAKTRQAYLVAISTLNGHGVAEATFDDLRTSLPVLWEHITRRGDNNPLVLPVLGSGFSRLPQPRETILREIVRSFIAACASRTFCSRMTVVVSPSDYHQHQINIVELGRFVEHLCRYASFAPLDARGAGTALPDPGGLASGA